MRRGTQGHVVVPRGPTQRIHIFIIYIVYIMDIHPSVYRKGIQPLDLSHVINQTISLNFSHVGLSPTEFLRCR